MKKFFAVTEQSMPADLAMLFLRVIVGYAFMMHGWGKIQNPFGWMGPDSSIPSIFLALAALSEFGGGLALIVGLLTRLGALGIAFTMVVAVYMHRFSFGDPFINPTGGKSYELAAVFLAIALVIVAQGPGRFSLDRALFGTRGR